MIHTIVLVLHVIGAGLMLGTVFFAFIIALKKVLDPSKLSLLKNIFVFGTIGAIWQTITGIILYFQEKDEFEDSKIFLVKIVLFILDGIVALLIIDRRIKAIEAKSKGEINLEKTYLWNLLSLLIIVSVITLGVFLTEG